PSVTDYWRCQQAGQPTATCDYKDLTANFVKSGNPDLKPENGKSYGFGFVWSPSADADLSLDYWNISINDLVTDLDQDKILRDEAACRSGQLDSNSSLCQDALRRVQRNPANAVLDPGAINQILTNPINAANELLLIKINYLIQDESVFSALRIAVLRYFDLRKIMPA
ncbi:hypothetical protein C3L29_036085, partial [Pseudomonas sp. MWU12-2534b]